MRRILICFAAILPIATSCHEVAGPRAVSPNAVIQDIGTNGGSLTSKTGELALTVPPGALTTGKTITLDPITSADLGAEFTGVPVQQAYELGPSGTTFARPVTVTVRIPVSASVHGDTVRVSPRLLLTSVSGKLTPLNNLTATLSNDTIVLSGQLTHFSPLVVTEQVGSALTITSEGIPARAEVGKTFAAVVRGLTPASNIYDVADANFVWGGSTTLIDPEPSGAFKISADLHSFSQAFSNQCVDLGQESWQLNGSYTLTYHREGFFAGLDRAINNLAGPGDVTGTFSIPKVIDCTPRRFVLHIVKTGDGSGTVRGSNADNFNLNHFECGANCDPAVDQYTLLGLNANADFNSRFAGWSGDCEATSGDSNNGYTTAWVSKTVTCTAEFQLRPVHKVNISILGAGAGTITGGGLDCPSKCTTTVIDGVTINLEASANAGSHFYRWSGDCGQPTPDAPTQTITPTRDLNCTAYFSRSQISAAVYPSQATVPVGQTQKLNVVLTDENGPVFGRRLTFTSENPLVASVSPLGDVLGIAPGTSAIGIKVEGADAPSIIFSNITVTRITHRLHVSRAGGGFLSMNFRTTTDSTAGFTGPALPANPRCDSTCLYELDESVSARITAQPSAGWHVGGWTGNCQPVPDHPDQRDAPMSEDRACSAVFQPDAPPVISFVDVRTQSGNSLLAPDNIHGSVLFNFDVTNLGPGQSESQFFVDDVPVGSCSEGGASSPLHLSCPLISDQHGAPDFTSPSPIFGTFRNGTHNCELRVTPLNQTGLRFPTVCSFENPSRALVSAADSGSGLVHGSNLRLGVFPLLFNGEAADALRVSLTPSVVAGGGTIVFDQSSPIAAPFLFTFNAGSSANVEGTFNFTPHVFNGADEIPGLVGDPGSFSLDFLAPRPSGFDVPSSTLISQGVLVLGHQTGIYPAGTHIPLTRINGGILVAKHLPFCDGTHVHSTIYIRQENSEVLDGPFTDPDITLGDPCGHGKIAEDQLSSIRMLIFGSVVDRQTPHTALHLFRSSGSTCFDAPLTPVDPGSAPGQSSNPFQQFTGTTVNTFFDLAVDQTFSGGVYCAVADFDDGVLLGAPGGPNANTARLIRQTTLSRFHDPYP